VTATLEVLATEMVQRHLDRNPRVVSYCDEPYHGESVYVVTYDPTVCVPGIIAAESYDLSLPELGRRVRNLREVAS
jgi:hypothetical protein